MCSILGRSRYLYLDIPPGQGSLLQPRTMVVLVLHSLPPCSGSLVMFLTQVCCPPPHSALQFPVAAQADSKQ